MKPDTLLETIRCENGAALHLPYHQKRLERSLHTLGKNCDIELSALIAPPDSSLYRCRFLYDGSDIAIEFHPYLPRTFSSLRLVSDDAIDYPLKYAKRDRLNQLYEQRNGCDDVVILKHGLLSDTTVANIALKIGERWLTPQSPLLYGTTRERLIDEGVLIPAPLNLNDIAKASKIAVMNAMVGFAEIENGIII